MVSRPFMDEGIIRAISDELNNPHDTLVAINEYSAIKPR